MNTSIRSIVENSLIDISTSKTMITAIILNWLHEAKIEAILQLDSLYLTWYIRIGVEETVISVIYEAAEHTCYPKEFYDLDISNIDNWEVIDNSEKWYLIINNHKYITLDLKDTNIKDKLIKEITKDTRYKDQEIYF